MKHSACSTLALWILVLTAALGLWACSDDEGTDTGSEENEDEEGTILEGTYTFTVDGAALIPELDYLNALDLCLYTVQAVTELYTVRNGASCRIEVYESIDFYTDDPHDSQAVTDCEDGLEACALMDALWLPFAVLGCTMDPVSVGVYPTDCPLTVDQWTTCVRDYLFASADQVAPYESQLPTCADRPWETNWTWDGTLPDNYGVLTGLPESCAVVDAQCHDALQDLIE